MIGRWRWPVAVGILAALLAVSGCDSLAGAVGERIRADGPLREVPEHAWTIGREVNVTFTDGFETLVFDTDGEIELEDVRLLGDPDLELVGVSLADPGRTIGSVQFMETYPPRHPDLNHHIVDGGLHVPLEARTRDDIGWELLLGIRATTPGRHVRTGIEVTYTHDGRTYRETLPALLAVCAGEGLELRDCELPELSTD